MKTYVPPVKMEKGPQHLNPSGPKISKKIKIVNQQKKMNPS
jgi:hypothetical protein